MGHIMYVGFADRQSERRRNELEESKAAQRAESAAAAAAKEAAVAQRLYAAELAAHALQLKKRLALLLIKYG